MMLKFLMSSILFCAAFMLGTTVAYYLARADFEQQQKQEQAVTNTVGLTVSVGEPLSFSTTTENMQIRWVSDPVQVREVLDEYWRQTGKLAVGLSMTINDKCVIYAFEPKYENDRSMNILGHEFTHCMRGTFHE